MIYNIEVFLKPSLSDHHGQHIKSEIADVGIKGISKVKFSKIYKFEGNLDITEVQSIAEKLLIDPITETYEINAKNKPKDKFIEVWLKTGVTDTVAESVIKAVNDLGISKDIKVKTGSKYFFYGKIGHKVSVQIAERLLVNSMVQEYTIK